MQTITGFHAIEEKLKSLSHEKAKCAKIYFDKTGPRAKKILDYCTTIGVQCIKSSKAELDSLVSHLDEGAKEHRGIVCQIETSQNENNIVEFTSLVPFLKKVWTENTSAKKRSVIVVLDSITDPHNVGAIIRSCDQFSVDLVVLPSHRGAKDSEIVARTSCGADSWVPLMTTVNLSRALEALKENGYWVYGADANGEDIAKIASFPDKIALVMGSEGCGISRLVKQHCDKIVSIKTSGKLDSLNVSVAAGVLLYALSQ